MSHDRHTVRAAALGERITPPSTLGRERLDRTPFTCRFGERGLVVLYRWGVVAAADLTEAEWLEVLQAVEPSVSSPFDVLPEETLDVEVDPAAPEHIDDEGIVAPDASVERLLLVADVLAKSVVLVHYEEGLREPFDRIEPLAARLARTGGGATRPRELMRQLGRALLIEQQMVWRVEVTEKPELVWDRPDLDKLCMRLQDWYELQERHLAVERKLRLLGRTADTLVEMLRYRRTLRVEWYIVLLILFEIVLSLYQLR